MLVHLAAFVIVVAGIMSAKSLLIPFLLAVFLAIVFSPALYWLQSKRVPVWLAVLFLLLVVLILQVGVTTLMGTSLAEFTKALPQYQARLQQLVKEGIGWLRSMGVEITDQAITDQLNPGRLFGLVGNLLNSLLAMLKNTVFILLTFVFILLEAAGIPLKLRAIAGGKTAPVEQYEAIIKGVNRYLAFKTLTSLLTGVAAWMSLFVIGVDFAVLWGMTAFLLNFIPTIGSIVAAVPPVVLALIQFGIGPAATTAVVYAVINISISNFLEPKIMGEKVGLSTLVIFLSMAFWGWVLGPMGMLLSVPLTMALRIGLASGEKNKALALLLGSNAEAAAALRSGKSKKAGYFGHRKNKGDKQKRPPG